MLDVRKVLIVRTFLSGVNWNARRPRLSVVAVFATPVPTTLEWRRIEALFRALGARVVAGEASCVRFELNGVVASFHRLHPAKEAKPYQVRDARAFLEQAGMKP